MAKKTIKQRAAAIIADERTYDESTREAVYNALTSKAADLTECVRRAEAGETILDLIGEQAKLDFAAQSIIDLFVVEEVPGFLKLAIEAALDRAAELAGVTIWEEEEGYSLRAMADLFAMTGGNFSLRKSDGAELADLLSKILRHPSVPTDLFNVVGEAVNSLNDAIDHDSPEHIEYALRAFERKEKEGQKKSA